MKFPVKKKVVIALASMTACYAVIVLEAYWMSKNVLGDQ